MARGTVKSRLSRVSWRTLYMTLAHYVAAAADDDDDDDVIDDVITLHIYNRNELLRSGAMRADCNSALFRYEVQLHAHAQPAWSHDPAGGRLPGPRVHTPRPGRLLALVEVLSLRRLRTDVYRTGRRGARHTAVPVHV